MGAAASHENMQSQFGAKVKKAKAEHWGFAQAKAGSKRIIKTYKLKGRVKVKRGGKLVALGKTLVRVKGTDDAAKQKLKDKLTSIATAKKEKKARIKAKKAAKKARKAAKRRSRKPDSKKLKAIRKGIKLTCPSITSQGPCESEGIFYPYDGNLRLENPKSLCTWNEKMKKCRSTAGARDARARDTLAAQSSRGAGRPRKYAVPDDWAGQLAQQQKRLKAITAMQKQFRRTRRPPSRNPFDDEAFKMPPYDPFDDTLLPFTSPPSRGRGGGAAAAAEPKPKGPMTLAQLLARGNKAAVDAGGAGRM